MFFLLFARYGEGKWHLRDHLKGNYNLASDTSRLKQCIPPEEIVDRIKNATKDFLKLVGLF